MPRGSEVRFSDMTLMLANKGIVLSASAMRDLGAKLEADGILTRVTRQRFTIPIITAQTAPKQQLTTEQRLFLVEQELAELKRQVAELSNRLL